MFGLTPNSFFEHYLTISRLLAGQLDFDSIIRAVAAEIRSIIPYAHFDVCVLAVDGDFSIAYEAGMESDWSKTPSPTLDTSPIREVLSGRDDFMLTADASLDPRFHFKGAFDSPIFALGLKSRLHVPLRAQGMIIGALSCSTQEVGSYTMEDVEKARCIADLLAPYFFAIRTTDLAKRSAIVEAEARAREEGLRQGALQLTEALEAERQRIGMDLHDQTLADLTRFARRLEQLSRVPEMSGAALDPLFRSVQQCMSDLRQIIEEAKPSVLQLFGFAQAIENHLERAVRDSGLNTHWKLKDETGGIIDTMDKTVVIALFRIVQEAINNAVRHGQAGLVRVGLRSDGHRLMIEVVDDGKGLGERSRRSGRGITNMRTRARLISARFDIGDGDDGRGTRVSVARAVTPGQINMGHG